jgi:cephalosporin-C deacetylase-like acetyl esterase
MSAHPDLVSAGFNVLHVSPLGYATPRGADKTKQRNDAWPVLPDTILSGGTEGYKTWLADCAMAVRWATGRPETCGSRISFFGTSQGGGGALLLASLFKDRGVRCVAADLPFLTDFQGAVGLGAYKSFANILHTADDKKAAWHAAGLIDTLSHVHRLDLPVLLTAGENDETCPPQTIKALFERLPGTRSYTHLEGVGHRYTTEFIPLAAAWFRLYA